MARGIRIVLDREAVEEIEDSYSDAVLELAEGAKKRADRMRSIGVAEFDVALRPGRKGGRHYAVVAANVPSTAADNARKNILAKAL